MILLLIETLPDSHVRDRLSDACDLTLEQYASRFDTSGYVVDSVPIAIIAATRSTNIVETIQQLVTFGGDTDTIASMLGQIFGAARGPRALPTETLQHVDAEPLVRETAKNLARTIDQTV